MRILIVGGTFDENGGRPSSVVQKMIDWLNSNTYTLVFAHNGGNVDEIPNILKEASDKGVVFWMPNVDNSHNKVRDVKKVNQRTLLVTSKRNDNEKYSFQELINRSLGQKANLTIEFARQDDGMFHMLVFDPLGTCWYDGDNIDDMMKAIMSRIRFLAGMQREGTHAVDGADETMSEIRKRRKDDMEQFIEIVKEYADVFHELIMPEEGVERFLGNASARDEEGADTTAFKNFRCTKGFPSLRDGDIILMSRRNVDKTRLSIEDFVPVFYIPEQGKLCYMGKNKPSVDTPIQIRLYEKLPNINYMIHSHCYIDGAPYTRTPVPCGALQEVREVMGVIDEIDPEHAATSYRINLVGHGSIIMGNTIDDMRDVPFIGRELPEHICEDK